MFVSSFRIRTGTVFFAAVVLAACASRPSTALSSPSAPNAAPSPARARGGKGAADASSRLDAGSASPSAALAPPPPAARKPQSQVYFGTTVSDDYTWLEDPKSPETKAFVDAENAYAQAFLGGIAERPRLHDRLEALMGQKTASFLDVARPRAAKGLFVLEAHPPKQQPILVFRKDEGRLEQVRVVVDPNVLDESGATTIDFFVPSPNGKLVAVSLSKGGSESGDVHVFDVATGKETLDVTPRVNGGTAGGSLAWNADGSGYYYTRYPRTGERPEVDLDFYQQVYFHKLGTPEAKDTYAVGKDFPRIAEIELQTSDDGRFVLARVANGDGGAFEHHVLVPGQAGWKRISTFDDELSQATFGPKGKLYLLSRKGAPHGKIVALAPPFDGPRETVLEEGQGVVEDMVVTPSSLYVVELVGGPSRIRRLPLDVKPEPLAREKPSPQSAKKKKPAPKPEPPPTIPAGTRGIASAELPLPPIASVNAVVRVGEDLLVRVGTYTSPRSWLRYAAREHRFVATDLVEPAPADMSDVEVVRELARSKDGTMVPMSILRKKGAKLDGKSPAILTGYGGYGVSLKPRFRPWYRVWLDAGGVVAEANLRGGGEMGDAWHRQGYLTSKQNVFDDFYACAEKLVELGYTNPSKLAITGRSNGGLLMGAALVQHPSMYRAVVSGVGIYDMLRSELSPNGAFNVTEFGTVKDEAQFRAMFAYSPFHNVKNGVAYPAVLLTTGANDPRVDPYQSRKMTARLRAATSSGRPILLRASAGTGHGMGSPLAEVIDETTDMLAFFFQELGMHLPNDPPAPPARATAK